MPESSQTPVFREKVFTDVLGPDDHGRVRTFGLGACPSQVFGTRFHQPQKQHVDMDRLREEVRQEVFTEFGDRFTRLERKCEKLQAHVESMGYPMPEFSDAPAPMPEHAGQVTSSFK